MQFILHSETIIKILIFSYAKSLFDYYSIPIYPLGNVTTVTTPSSSTSNKITGDKRAREVAEKKAQKILQGVYFNFDNICSKIDYNSKIYSTFKL